MTDRELMRQALEALESCAELIDSEWGECRSLDEMQKTRWYPSLVREPIIALREAIDRADALAAPMAKVVSTAPERIWLDLGFDPADEDIAFDQLFEATWSQDNATGWGIEYTRADLAAPPQRKPLTEEEIRDMWVAETKPVRYTSELVKAFARAIERAHGIGGQDD